ncbi:hypothetical protein [Sorangium sp. So ce204]|uniref:hypothetical protein n=1 Tax=Sorangium sp. So ce204 TaxID=3133288 RepID=UPI003F6484D7
MEGRLEEAELAYLRAWSRLKSSDIAVNLGQVQLRLNKAASAAKYLAYGVRAVGPEIEPERLGRMLALLDAAKAQVGTVRLQVTNAADAEVFVDGERVPAEEVKHEIYLEPGEHRIVIRRAGYEEAAIRVVAAAGVRETVPVAMKPVEAKAPEAERAPVAGGAPVVGNEKTKAPAAGARVEERSWVPVIALGAASAVGLGVAVGFTVASRDASAEVDADGKAVDDAGGRCKTPTIALADLCAELHDAGSRQETFGNAARVAFAASGALAIAAVTYALWPRAEPRGAAPVRVLPDVSAHGAGVTLFSVW